jgi:hypothetical protein
VGLRVKVGLRVYGSTGRSRSVGLRVYGSAGQSGSAGLRVYRSKLVCGSTGLQVYRSTGQSGSVSGCAGLQVCGSMPDDKSTGKLLASIIETPRELDNSIVETLRESDDSIVETPRESEEACSSSPCGREGEGGGDSMKRDQPTPRPGSAEYGVADVKEVISGGGG